MRPLRVVFRASTDPEPFVVQEKGLLWGWNDLTIVYTYVTNKPAAFASLDDALICIERARTDQLKLRAADVQVWP